MVLVEILQGLEATSTSFTVGLTGQLWNFLVGLQIPHQSTVEKIDSYRYTLDQPQTPIYLSKNFETLNATLSDLDTSAAVILDPYTASIPNFFVTKL